MRYLLDTDTCVYLINRRSGYERALEHLRRLQYGDILISAITLGELEVGIAKSARADHNRQRVKLFLARFEIAPFDGAAANAYGTLRMELECKGRPIGPLDMLIAAQALALRAILITNNTREFSRVSGLKLENWFPPS